MASSVGMKLRSLRSEDRSLRWEGVQRRLRGVQRARERSSVWAELVLRRLEGSQRTLRSMQRRLDGFILTLRGFKPLLHAFAAWAGEACCMRAGTGAALLRRSRG